MPSQDFPEELYTKKLTVGGTTYYFDIKKTKKGDKYLKITETGFRDGQKVSHRILIFEDHAEEFKNALDEAIGQLQNLKN